MRVGFMKCHSIDGIYDVTFAVNTHAPTKTMVITYVYAKNSAPRADRGFLNDVQNTNSNCDITM